MKKADVRRFGRFHDVGCVACHKRGLYRLTQAHHLNLGGNAGQKRRGHDKSLPLCEWHHQGITHDGKTAAEMRALLGPSLAVSSRDFRHEFGSDDELLAEADELIDAHERRARGA